MSLALPETALVATAIAAPSVFEGLDVVKLVQAGATGFAVVMLFFGYQTVRQILGQTPGDTKPAQEAYGRKVYLSYFFLVISLLFAGLGLTGQFFLHSQQNEVTVGVTPAEFPHSQRHVQVLHGVDGVILNDKGRGIVLVRHQDELIFDMTAILLDQLSLNTGRAQSIVANSSEGGFDEPK